MPIIRPCPAIHPMKPFRRPAFYTWYLARNNMSPALPGFFWGGCHLPGNSSSQGGLSPNTDARVSEGGTDPVCSVPGDMPPLCPVPGGLPPCRKGRTWKKPEKAVFQDEKGRIAPPGDSHHDTAVRVVVDQSRPCKDSDGPGHYRRVDARTGGDLSYPHGSIRPGEGHEVPGLFSQGFPTRLSPSCGGNGAVTTRYKF